MITCFLLIIIMNTFSLQAAQKQLERDGHDSPIGKALTALKRHSSSLTSKDKSEIMKISAIRRSESRAAKRERKARFLSPLEKDLVKKLATTSGLTHTHIEALFALSRGAVSKLKNGIF